MHTTKKDTRITKKSRYSDPFLETATLTPRKQQQKISFSISDTFKKETMHKYCHRPIIDLRFSP
jgi:hypothetical protein